MEEPRLARREAVPDALIEQVLVGGDLAQLTPARRPRYSLEPCRSLRLNPLTRPFEYLNIGGKLTLYARKDATDQLRRLHGISVEIVDREQVGEDDGAGRPPIEALPAPRPAANTPQRRAVEAMLRACTRAGLSPSPPPDGAGRA